jgi:hypothetical protein
MEIGMFGFGSLPLEYPLELLGFPPNYGFQMLAS